MQALGSAVPFWLDRFYFEQAARADNMQLIDSPSGKIMGGVYTSPYDIKVNGVLTALVCDDFTTDINFGYTWTANQ